MKRKYFVQVADQETGEPLYAGEVDGCESIEEAIERGREIGISRSRGRKVRVTHATEAVDLTKSWFLRRLEGVAA